MQPITKIEYDTIRSDSGELTPDEFRELEEYVLSDGRAVMSETLKHGVRILKANSYVGTILLSSGRPVEILPKIAGVIDPEESKKVLMKMLQTVFSVKTRTAERSSLDSRPMTVIDLFTDMFLSKVETLMAKGLRGRYNRTEGNRTFIRGHIDFKQNIRRNSHHMERFYLNYREFSLDRPENRIIKTTLLMIKPMIRDPRIKKRMNGMLFELEGVPESDDTGADLELCSCDRNMSDYRDVLELCRIFLDGECLTLFSGRNRTSSFLLPMERVFESYVASYVRETYGHRFRVRIQYCGKSLFDSGYLKLKPDIILDDGKERVIIDTKWKTVRKRSDISEADMYQMYVYSRRFGTSRTVLLYPYCDTDNTMSFSSDGVRVDVRYIDILGI